MKIYSRSSRAALHYHLRIIAALVILQPSVVIEPPPISEDHWPKAHIYMPLIGNEVRR